jgi:hypothetical protein
MARKSKTTSPRKISYNHGRKNKTKLPEVRQMQWGLLLTTGLFIAVIIKRLV